VSDRFEELRAEIAANDAEIVRAVNHRLRLVEELWRLKAERGDERLDPDRERRLREALARLNEGPLSEQGLERLVEELLALTKRELGGRSPRQSGASSEPVANSSGETVSRNCRNSSMSTSPRLTRWA